jgi:predicted extracellular nuclease
VQRSGAPALAKQDLNNRSRIQLDDGSNVQNPLPLPLYLSKDNTLRLSASVLHIDGALGYSFGKYENQPTFPAVFSGGEHHTELLTIPNISKVVEMNVLNYFTTLDTGAPIYGLPKCRLYTRAKCNSQSHDGA